MRRVALVSMVAAFVLAGCGSRASYAPDEQVTAGDLTGNLLAHGTVTSDGKALAGARVMFQLTADGQRWSAPTVKTGADGSWALHLNARDIPKAYFPEPHSFLEFDLVFADGARISVWSGTVYLRDDPDVWRTEAAGPKDGVLRVDADLGTGKLTAVDSLGDPMKSGA